MLRRFSINFAIFSMLLDAICVVFGLWAASIVRPWLHGISFVKFVPGVLEIPLALYILFPILWVGILTSFSIYDGRKYLKVVDEFSALTLGSFIASISMAGILYISYRDTSRALFLIFVIFAYLLFISWRGIARLGFRMSSNFPDEPRRVLIVGVGPLGRQVSEELDQAGVVNLSQIGFVDDLDVSSQGVAQVNVLGRIEEIGRIITESHVTDVVVALPYSVYQRMNEVISLTTELPVKVWVALGLSDLALYRTDIDDFAGIPMLDLRAPALNNYQRLVKRASDLILGILVFPLAIILMGIISLLIRIFDGSPVVFKQTRLGENGRLFTLYKFRTMVHSAGQQNSMNGSPHENGNQVHKTRSDPRVTRLGRILRRMSLDELPQLFNVLEGSMSLVGPRPELPDLAEKYEPWQRKRFAVPPGITGWWQINGRSERMMHLHTEDDLYYIIHYSLWLDIQIMIRTIWAVILGRGAF